jgi:hypothetical protein
MERRLRPSQIWRWPADESDCHPDAKRKDLRLSFAGATDPTRIGHEPRRVEFVGDAPRSRKLPVAGVLDERIRDLALVDVADGLFKRSPFFVTNLSTRLGSVRNGCPALTAKLYICRVWPCSCAALPKPFRCSASFWILLWSGGTAMISAVSLVSSLEPSIPY